MNKLFIFFSFLGLNISNAQFSKEYTALKEKYPDTHYVKINDETDITIRIVNDELKIEETVSYESIYLSQSARFGAKQEIDYSSFSEVKNIEANSYIFKNNKYSKIPVTEFIESDNLGRSFYDDLKKISYYYKGVEEGAKVTQSYKRVVKNPRFLSGHFFGDRFPILHSKLSITVDSNVNLDFKEFSTDSINLKFSKKVGKRNTVYTWEVKNSPKIDIESDAPNFRKRLPNITPYIKSYTVNGEKVNLSGSVDNLYNWYYSLTKDLNKTSEQNEELEKLVKSLIKDKTSDIEKVKAIYYWVQENIKYIAFEYALGGFIPRQAVDVFNKKYGDCKDNSSILEEMLKIANLKGYLTWVGTRSIPFTYEEMPTPAVDNHMILSYLDEKENLFLLDATGRYIPLDIPTSFIQGKEVLIGLDENKYLIKKAPIVPAKRNTFKDSISIKIENKNISGTGKIVLNGYPKIDFFNSLETIKTEKNKTTFYNRFLRKGSNRFLVDTFKEINKYDYDKPFEINYDFNIKDYINSFEDEVYINMNFFEGIENFKTSEFRKSGKEYRYKSFTELTSVLEIPSDMKVDYIPEKKVYEEGKFKCEIDYKINKNKVIYTLIVLQDFIVLDYTQQKKLNNIVTQILKKQKDVVVLKKK